MDYNSQLIFSDRFRAASKGSSRPTICDMDWHPAPSPFGKMLALCSSKLLRAFGWNGNAWKMLINRKPSGMRKTNALKWNPRKGSCLAVATGDGRRVTIDFLKLKGQRFKRIKLFEVTEAGFVSSLSWDSSGKLLLAAIKRDAYHPQGQMYVIKRQSKRRYRSKKIVCEYQCPFTSVFHPKYPQILSASIESTEILVWSEDTVIFEWIISFRISTETGITNMCVSYDGAILAAIVAKRLMIWTYSDKELGFPCHPKLVEIQYENDDGIRRSRGVSLSRHCENIVALNWSRSDFLLTGSSLGTMCVHMLNPPPEEPAPREELVFKVVYFRWSYVHAHHKDGPVSCVNWLPGDEQQLALAGLDGVVVVWKLANLTEENTHSRNYLKEINYFYPGRQSYASGGVLEHDVDSIASISVSGSQECSETEESSEEEVEDVVELQEAGNEVEDEEQQEPQSSGVRSRVQKVLEGQDDIKVSVSETSQDVQEVLKKVKALEEYADENGGTLSDLVGFAEKERDKIDVLLADSEQVVEKLKGLDEATEKRKNEVTSLVQDEVLPQLDQLETKIKNLKDEVLAAVEKTAQKQEVASTVQEVLLRLNGLENDMKRLKDEVIGVVQKIEEHEDTKVLLSQAAGTVQQILSKMKDDMQLQSQEILTKLKQLDENGVGQKRISDELILIVKQVLDKQNEMESSVLAKYHSLESNVLRRHNQLEMTTIKKLNDLDESIHSQLQQMEERNMKKQTESAQKMDAIKELLEKLCLSLPQAEG